MYQAELLLRLFDRCGGPLSAHDRRAAQGPVLRRSRGPFAGLSRPASRLIMPPTTRRGDESVGAAAEQDDALQHSSMDQAAFVQAVQQAVRDGVGAEVHALVARMDALEQSRAAAAPRVRSAPQRPAIRVEMADGRTPPHVRVARRLARGV